MRWVLWVCACDVRSFFRAEAMPESTSRWPLGDGAGLLARNHIQTKRMERPFLYFSSFYSASKCLAEIYNIFQGLKTN